MTYETAIDYIMSRRKFQKISSHERIRRLLELLGNPHDRLNFVHVVGTNGKGSVSTALSSIMTASGCRTGLFTSPFIIKFNERIKVDGEFIPDSDVAEITALIKEKNDLMEMEGLYPTVFEVTTALAMVYFERTDCDIVILEAGIGGKNDSTNVINDKLLSVITSVSQDHTDMLGSTVKEIADEKCGIILPDVPTVSYPFTKGNGGFIPQNPDAARVITDSCTKKGSPLIIPDTKKLKVTKSDLFGTDFRYGSLAVTVRLCGKHQVGNMLTVIEAARALRNKGYTVTDESIIKGIGAFTIPGRTEIISRNPLIILDGGHNEGCLRALRETSEAFLSDKKITLLCSFMKDKDYEKSLGYILPLCENAVFTCTDPVRGEKPETLKLIADAYCSSFCEKDTQSALKKALELTDKGALIVCGSFYLVSEVRKMLGASSDKTIKR